MGMPAVFIFTSKHGPKQPTRIYTHYGGYPEGAAAYLYATLISPSKGSLATQFIRAVEMAEICDADTYFNYVYRIHGHDASATITARKFDLKTDEEIPIGICTLADFFEAHRDTISEYVGDYHPFIEAKIRYSKRWMNLTTARQYMETDRSGPLHHLRIWSESKPFDDKTFRSGNWQSMIGAMNDLISTFPELESDETRRFNSLTSQAALP